MVNLLAQRMIVLVAMTCIQVLLTGCAGLNIFRSRQPNDQMASVPRPRFSSDPQLEEVVDHLNRNVEKLHAWQARSVKIRANNMPLSGTLAVQEGQHLRLVVHSIAGHEVDMGSNEDVFWIWAKRMEPSYVYCEHTQIDVARQTLGIPFEPQWLMQALGVAPLDTRDLQMQIDPSGRQARLVQPVITAHGQPLQKVMHVDLVHGVITEHSIYNGHGHKIAQARLEDFRLDKSSGVVMARRIRLDWPQNQMCLVMNLGNVEINPDSIPSQIWDMPKPMPGVQMVDLGKVEGRTRIAEFDDGSRFRERNSLDSGDGMSDDAGHVQLSLDDTEPDSEIKFDRPEAVDPVEYRTEPIERPEPKRPQAPRWDEE